MDDDKLAQLVVRYSTAVRPGEVVSLIGPPAVEPLVAALYREVLRAGGHPIVAMRPEACDEWLCREGSAPQLGFIDPLEEREAEVADVAVHIVPVPAPPKDIDPGRYALHERARQPLLRAFLERCAGGSVRWTAVAYPRPILSAACQETLVCAQFLAEADPVEAWRQQERRQARLIEFLQSARELHFRTPAGTDLRIGVAGRRWCNGGGRQNLPDGEVFTAPLDNSTNGTACFDWPTVCGGQVLEGVRLRFRAGRLVDASAQRGENVLRQLLDSDEAVRALGELGLGCNYAIERPLGHPLVDEKIGGTFHLALGMVVPASGGLSQPVGHFDLVADLRQGGRIEADGHVLNDHGRFIDEIWPPG